MVNKRSLIFLTSGVLLLVFIVTLRNSILLPHNALLFAAASRGEADKVYQLWRFGASVSTSDFEGSTPLMEAAAKNHNHVVVLLINLGADVNAKASEWNRFKTALHEASIHGYADTVDILLTSGADINSNTNEGLTPLMYAVLNDHTDVVEILLKRGADFNLRSYQGHSALSLAKRERHEQIARLLIDTGAKD